MLQGYSTRKSKHSKVHYQQYLYNSGEPRDVSSRDTLPGFEDQLLGDSRIMRQHFRHLAHRMRNQIQ
jgi:hypothetical protein